MRYLNRNKSKLLFLLILLTAVKPISILPEGQESHDRKNIIWEEVSIPDNQVNWSISSDNKNSEIQEDKTNLYPNNISKKPIIRSLGKSVTVNGYPYPDLSIYVPNAFLTDQDRTMSISFRGIGRVRHCKTDKILSENCSDGILEIDYSTIKLDNFSLDLKLYAASLSDRGTDFGEGLSLGFKTAFEIFDDWPLSLGADHIIHFDEHTDLGRNIYLVSSKYFLLNSKEKPAILFLTGGLGTDFYGYKGNGFLGKLNCFGNNNLTGDGSDKCQVGPILAGSLAFNDRFSVGGEWFGYGFASGISIRPFADMPVSFSLSVTDFLGNFPKYIEETCKFSPCRPRILGLATISF